MNAKFAALLLRMRPAVMLLAGFLLPASLLAQTPESAQPRPRVGLVLAGGGAKGGAHVGVLKVLEEMRVPVDCIAGTSMGALVGGGYAAGMPLPEMEKFLLSIDWAQVIGGQGQRDLEPIEQKRSGVTYSNSLDLGIQDGKVRMSSSLINANNIDNLLREYVAAARRQPNFDRLPIPFRAVATDMLSGDMVVLSGGDLATALRASMAIPAAFAPVETDEYVLADGGAVRNIPIDVARELCADVVIVVNLVETPPTRDDLRTAASLLTRSTDVMFEVNEKIQLATLKPEDVLVNVPVGDIGTAQFQRIKETIPLGVGAARAVEDRLRELAVSPEQYATWRRRVTLEQEVQVKVADIQYQGLKRINPEYLASGATVKAGDVVDSANLSAEAQRIGVLEDVESVGYVLKGDPEQASLVWLPVEKAIGPDYLKVDLGMYASVGGDLAFNLYGEHRRTWLNSRGGMWRNQIQIGRESYLSTSIYQPLDVNQAMFVEPNLFLAKTSEDVFYDDRRVAQYAFTDVGASFDVGANFGNRLQARLGYTLMHRKSEIDVGSPLLPEGSADDAGIQVNVTYDSRDSRFNPTHGLAVALEYIDSSESLGASRDWQRAELGVGLAVPVLGRDVWWVTLAGGSSLDNRLPADRAFLLGGPSSFPGFELGELRVGGYWTAASSYLWKFKDMTAIRGDALYAGLRLQAARTYNSYDNFPGEAIFGGSLFLTGRTIVGPLTLGLGGTSTDSWSLWLAVGRPVGHGTILEKGIFR